MKFILRGEINFNLKVMLGRLGYHASREARPGEQSFIRRLGRLDYPRYHLYVTLRGHEVHINLHLDQKQPSYAGTNRHAGIYNGPELDQELNRILQYFNQP